MLSERHTSVRCMIGRVDEDFANALDLADGVTRRLSRVPGREAGSPDCVRDLVVRRRVEPLVEELTQGPAELNEVHALIVVSCSCPRALRWGSNRGSALPSARDSRGPAE